MKRLAIYGIIPVFLLVVYLAVYGGHREPMPVLYTHPSQADVKAGSGRSGKPKISVNARSALVIDNSSGVWIYEKTPQQVQPIASLTKLLTAMVYLDAKAKLDSVVHITNIDCFESSRSSLRRGEGYRAIDLLYIALMASDNRAARALATASGLTREVFVQRMNEKARSLGMMYTEIFEATGLDERNVSSAADIALLVNAAVRYPLIKRISSTREYQVRPQNRKRTKRFVNTNRFVQSQWDVLAGKTGYILESSYCLATVLRNGQGKELTVVVLGAPTNGSRFRAVRKLADYGFKLAGRKKNGAQQISG